MRLAVTRLVARDLWVLVWRVEPQQDTEVLHYTYGSPCGGQLGAIDAWIDPRTVKQGICLPMVDES